MRDKCIGNGTADTTSYSSVNPPSCWSVTRATVGQGVDVGIGEADENQKGDKMDSIPAPRTRATPSTCIGAMDSGVCQQPLYSVVGVDLSMLYVVCM